MVKMDLIQRTTEEKLNGLLITMKREIRSRGQIASDFTEPQEIRDINLRIINAIKFYEEELEEILSEDFKKE
jgi:hypothetical protein